MIFLDIDIEEAYARILKRKNLKQSKRIYKKVVKFFTEMEYPQEALYIDAKKDLKFFKEEIKKVRLC